MKVEVESELLRGGRREERAVNRRRGQLPKRVQEQRTVPVEVKVEAQVEIQLVIQVQTHMPTRHVTQVSIRGRIRPGI